MSLKKYREALGLTQKDVAARVGLSANRYAQIERGDVALPRMETRRQICEVLGIRHVDFLVSQGVLDDWEVPGFDTTSPAADPTRSALLHLVQMVDLERDGRAATVC